MESRKAARPSGRPRSCHQRFSLPNGGVGSAIDRAYAGTVSREATNPRSPEAMMISTFGARWAHACSGMLMYMLPWKRRYAGRSPPGRTDPVGLLWSTSSRSPSSFARIVAGRAAAIESTSGASDDPPLALRVLSGINTTISGFAIEGGNAAMCISSCDRGESRLHVSNPGAPPPQSRSLRHWISSPATERRRPHGPARTWSLAGAADPATIVPYTTAGPGARSLSAEPHRRRNRCRSAFLRGPFWRDRSPPPTEARSTGGLESSRSPPQSSPRLPADPRRALRGVREPPKRKFKRLFLAADLHGSEITFRKFLGAATFYDADALFIGGDLTAKSITPIVEQRDGRYQTRLAGGARDNLTEAELAPIEKAIADSGPYPVRMTEDEYARFRANPDKVESLFTDRMIDQIRRWTELAEKHLAPLDIPLYWIGGNDDKSEALLQAESTPHVHFIDEKVVRFDEDHEILGFGWTNPSPWRTPRELSEDGLKRRLDPLLSRVEDPARCIYLMHAPPYGTGLDIAPKLDATTDPPRPVVQGGQQVLIPVGSTTFRSAILETQPVLGLHGHIHETKNAAKLKRTVCVDPGSEYNSGTLRGAIVNLERDRVLGYQFTTG